MRQCVEQHPRVVGDGEASRIVFLTPIPTAGITDGILVSVGLRSRETLRCKVFDIEPREDLKAALTLVDEANEVHRHG